jgi:hypothetical protein
MDSTPASLYEVLAESPPASASASAGETISTKAKETIDNDVESLPLEELIRGS